MGYRLLHWGPIIALSVIAAISSSTVACDIQWWPLNTLGAFLNIFVFAIWNALTLYNFFRAAFIGPGYIPLDWKPEEKEDVQHLQFCSTCSAYKAPRSHHCRKCGRCVMKMDHHCPWINNCVGHFNHANFTAFLFFAPCGCFHALCILIPSLYRAINRTYYIFYGTGEEPLVNLGFTALVFSMVSVGLAFGVIIAVGGLFVIQIRSIIRNETGIESWIREKAEYRDREEGEPDFVYPYDLGRWRNFRMVLHWNTRPELNGIWWPVRDGCNQFTLTIEQLEQKKEKRERSVVYVVSRPFNGSLCPLSYGLRVCCCPPCMDEQRVRLQVGDRVLVSRFRKHWLYGDKMMVNGSFGNAAATATAGRHRGWFPRKCATRWSKHDGDGPHGDVMADAINNGVNHSAEHGESDRSTKKDD